MSVQKLKLGTNSSLMTTELNALGTATMVAASSAFNNTQGQTGDGYTMALLTLKVDYVSAPTANTAVSIWFLRSNDGGTTFEDGSASLQPARPFDGQFAVTATTAAQVLMCEVRLPPGVWKPLVRNDTGQAFPATGSTLEIYPYTAEMV